MYKTLIFLFIALFSTTTLAEDKKKCELIDKERVSLYYLQVATPTQKFGSIYESKIKKIEDIIEKHKIKGFTWLSQDMSSNKSTYGNDAFDLSITLSFEFDRDYDAMTVLIKESESANINFSRQIDCF